MRSHIPPCSGLYTITIPVAASDGDGADRSRTEGLSRHDALVDACRKRARPILMTTVTIAMWRLVILLCQVRGSSTT